MGSGYEEAAQRMTISPRHSVCPCLHWTPSSSVRLFHLISARHDVSLNRQTYLPIMLTLKSTLSDTFAMAGKTSFCRQSRASGHLDMMCTSTGTLVSTSRCLCSPGQLHVVASQNKLTNSAAPAIWNQLVRRHLEEGIVASRSVVGACSGRRGAFSSIIC